MSAKVLQFREAPHYKLQFPQAARWAGPEEFSGTPGRFKKITEGMDFLVGLISD